MWSHCVAFFYQLKLQSLYYVCIVNTFHQTCVKRSTCILKTASNAIPQGWPPYLLHRYMYKVKPLLLGSLWSIEPLGTLLDFPKICLKSSFLQVRFSGFPSKLLCDEVVQTMAEFTNCSECHLEKLYIATPNPEFFTFGGDLATLSEHTTIQSNVKCNSTLSNMRRISEVPIPGGSLCPGYTTKLGIWIQGHGKPGKFKREVVFYYQSAGTKSLMRWDHHEAHMVYMLEVTVVSAAVSGSRCQAWPGYLCHMKEIFGVIKVSA